MKNGLSVCLDRESGKKFSSGHWDRWEVGTVYQALPRTDLARSPFLPLSLFLILSPRPHSRPTPHFLSSRRLWCSMTGLIPTPNIQTNLLTFENRHSRMNRFFVTSSLLVEIHPKYRTSFSRFERDSTIFLLTFSLILMMMMIIIIITFNKFTPPLSTIPLSTRPTQPRKSRPTPSQPLPGRKIDHKTTHAPRMLRRRSPIIM